MFITEEGFKEIVEYAYKTGLEYGVMLVQQRGVNDIPEILDEIVKFKPEWIYELNEDAT